MSLTSVEFDQVCREALEQAGDLPTAVRDRLIEDLRLRFEHPGQYVAYLDRYETVDKLRRLRRLLIAHSADLEQVQASNHSTESPVTARPPEDQPGPLKSTAFRHFP